MERDVARTIVWLTAEQAAIVRRVAAAARLEIVLAGSPVKGQSGAVAAELGAAAADDLRAVLTHTEADLAWLVAPGPFGTGHGEDDVPALLAAHARGMRVAASEPVPASAMDLAGVWAEEPARAAAAVRFVPLMRLGRAWREAAELFESFGPIRALSLESWGAPAEGSLGARLFSAIDLVLAWMGQPESVDAAYVSPGHGRGIHALPGESLRDLHGDLTANLRFADGRAASLALSDQAGRWDRSVTLLGPGGRLRIWDWGFEWADPAGATVDESRLGPADGSGPSGVAVEAMAEGLRGLLDRLPGHAAPLDQAAILTTAQAALLSARTGQGENPATIARMAGAV